MIRENLRMGYLVVKITNVDMLWLWIAPKEEENKQKIWNVVETPSRGLEDIHLGSFIINHLSLT